MDTGFGLGGAIASGHCPALWPTVSTNDLYLDHFLDDYIVIGPSKSHVGHKGSFRLTKYQWRGRELQAH